MSELNQWELSIVDRLRYGLQHNQSVTLGADEVHIPMNAIIERGNRRAQPENEPIVRCGECIHFEPYDGEEHKGNCNELVGLDSCMYEDDYCSYGERKPERSEG